MPRALQFFASGRVNIEELSHGDYSTMLTKPEVNNCLSLTAKALLNSIVKFVLFLKPFHCNS